MWEPNRIVHFQAIGVAFSRLAIISGHQFGISIRVTDTNSNCPRVGAELAPLVRKASHPALSHHAARTLPPESIDKKKLFIESNLITRLLLEAEAAAVSIPVEDDSSLRMYNISSSYHSDFNTSPLSL